MSFLIIFYEISGSTDIANMVKCLDMFETCMTKNTSYCYLESNEVLVTCFNGLLFCFFQFLLANFSDFQLTSLGGFIVHESAFFLSGIPFILFEKAGWFGKYKIQVME